MSKQLLDEQRLRSGHAESAVLASSATYNSFENRQSQLQAQAIADAQAQSTAFANAQALAEAQVRTQTLAQARQNSQAELRARNQLAAEAEARNLAEAQARAEGQARAEAEARAQAEIRAQEEAHSQVRSQAELQALAQAEQQARVKAQQLMDEFEHQYNQQQRLQIQQLQQQQQQQLLRTEAQATQERLTNDQALLLAQSLPSQALGHNVRTAVITHPPTLLSRTTTGTVFAHPRNIAALKETRISVERTVHPQIVLTQPPTATVQTRLVHSPLLLETNELNSGLLASNTGVLLSGSGQRSSEQLLTNLENSELQNSLIHHGSGASSSSVRLLNGSDNTGARYSYESSNGQDNLELRGNEGNLRHGLSGRRLQNFSRKSQF